MANAPLGAVTEFLRRMADAQVYTASTDSALVKGFLTDKDEKAFITLLKRHGPMVLRVGRGVLGNDHDVEDIFQATFLLLARKAKSIRKHQSIASWLYGVANRLALNMKRREATRQAHERQAADMGKKSQVSDDAWQELQTALHEALTQLPEKYRAALLMCYLEGKTQEEAAQCLGCPVGTISSRLARGRRQLHKLLQKRGSPLSATALAAAFGASKASAAVEFSLVRTTAKAALEFASGQAATALVSAKAATLVGEGLKAMMTMKLTVAIALLIGTLGIGAGAVVYLPTTQNPPEKASEAKGLPAPPQAKVKEDPPPVPRVDLFGDPLPAEALARLGTVRFRANNAYSLVYSPDGRVLAAGGDYFGVCIWDANTGQPLKRIASPHQGYSLTMSPDGKLIVVGGQGRSVIDVATGSTLRHLEGAGNYSCLAFSADGTTVAALDARSTVVLWNVHTGRRLRLLVPDAAVDSICFSPDGKTLASGHADKTVRFWEVANGKELRRFKGHDMPVSCVTFAPNGMWLASVDHREEGSEIRLWEVETGKVLHQWKAENYLTVPMAFTPDGKQLAFFEHGSVVHIWDTVTGKELRRWKGINAQAATFSPDGKVLATADWGSAIRRWDTSNGKEIEPHTDHRCEVASLAFLPDGKTLISCDRRMTAFEWDISTSRQARKLFPVGIAAVKQFTFPMGAVTISADGKLAALNMEYLEDENSDLAVRIWDTEAAKEISVLEKADPGYHMDLTFSPDRKILATTTENAPLELWEVASGKKLRELPGISGVSRLAFSPDSRYMAVAEFGGPLSLWDVASGKKVRQWSRPPSAVTVPVFSADGKLIASPGLNGGGGYDIRVWLAATGKEVARFQGTATIKAVAISPSGRMLAGCGAVYRTLADGTRECTSKIYLWEIASGLEVRQIDSQQGCSWSVAFHPNGRVMASGGGDSTVMLWDITGQRNSPKPKAGPLTTKNLDEQWSALAGDAAQADNAIWALAFAPTQSLPLLKERLRPAATAPAGQVAKLIADLDDKRFAARQIASKALDDMGEAAEAALRRALEGNPALEVRQRIEQILERQNRDMDMIRKLRAIEALEQIGTPEARQLLQELAKGTPNPHVAGAAGAAFQRLAR